MLSTKISEHHNLVTLFGTDDLPPFPLFYNSSSFLRPTLCIAGSFFFLLFLSTVLVPITWVYKEAEVGLVHLSIPF